jgi:hypothetical protein
VVLFVLPLIKAWRRITHSGRVVILVTLYSPSHVQACVKILKFTLNFKLFFTSVVYYMFRPTWSSFGAMRIAVETATFSSVTPMNTIYVPACCYTSVTCNSNCVSESHMEYIMFPIMFLDVYLLLVLGVFSCVSCAGVMSVYGFGCFLICRIDGACVLLSSVKFSQCFGYRSTCINVCVIDM